MEFLYNMLNTYQNIKSEMFNNYVITYGYYDKKTRKSIIFYNYDNIFYILYLSFSSLFYGNYLENKCIGINENYVNYLKDNKNKDIVPFGVYYKDSVKHGFINNIDISNNDTKNKVLYAIVDDLYNFSYYFEMFFNSLKRNIHITYEDAIIIFTSILDKQLFNIGSSNNLFKKIVIFFIDKYEENVYNKDDIIKIYD